MNNVGCTVENRSPIRSSTYDAWMTETASLEQALARPRAGQAPRTTLSNPHTQLDQQPDDPRLATSLAAYAFSLPHVVQRPSMISVPGARALWLEDSCEMGPPEAFMVGREFAHIHPDPDHSLHMMLPLDIVEHAIAGGWGEPHPVARLGLIPATAIMVYAPRDEAELAVVEGLVRASWAFASNQLPARDQPTRV